MSLQSIRNLNLFAALAAGYIGIMSPEKDNTVFMMELRECSKRIYDVPKFIFYALGYAIERFLASGMTMEEVSVKMDVSIEDLTKLLNS